MQRKTICSRACSLCLFRSIDSYSDQNSWISQPFWQKKMKASKLPPIWALNLSIKKNESFKITPYLSTLSSNSNHSLNLSINVSIDQCWILFPSINVNLSFVKAKQMENVMAKKLFCTECSRILSQPLKKKKSKRMQRKTICTRACSLCLFRSIDSYSDQNSWISQPILTKKNESFKITLYLNTQSILQKKWKFKITPYLSTLSSNSNHSLNISINVSIDQCWIFFPTINVNFSFVKAKQIKNIIAKKLFCTECSRILSQPLKKKKSKRMQRKTICTRACSFCLFRSIDSYSDQNS